VEIIVVCLNWRSGWVGYRLRIWKVFSSSGGKVSTLTSYHVSKVEMGLVKIKSHLKCRSKYQLEKTNKIKPD
jgi:hypothetical protein